jgi:hypothetical protein
MVIIAMGCWWRDLSWWCWGRIFMNDELELED